MTLREKIGKELVRVFVHPLHPSQPVDYKNSLKKAKRVLIALPTDMESIPKDTIANFIHLFPRKGLVILNPDHPTRRPEQAEIPPFLNCPVLSPKISRKNPLGLINSKSVKQLCTNSFDVFLDLDPDFSLLNVYLCRALLSPLRISFSKPYSHQFYNLEYKGKFAASYTKNLENLFQLLKSLIS